MVGIALAAYNPNFSNFNKQLLSIQNQSYKSWVCVVTFDAGYDEFNKQTVFYKIRSDPRFVFLKNKTRLGHKKNFEFACYTLLEKHKNIKFLAFSDQDDIWYPDKLQKKLDLFKGNSNALLVHSDMHILDDNKGKEKIRMIQKIPVTGWQIEKRLPHLFNVNQILVKNIVTGASMMIRSELYKKYSVISDSFDFHDHWFAAVASINSQIFYISEPLFSYRQHTENVVGISNYKHFFHIKNRKKIIFQLRKVYIQSNERFLVINNLKELSKIDHFVFFKKYDLGLGFLFLSLRHMLKGNFSISKSYLANSLGKILTILF